ncbi:Fructose-bisphosphate aldolase class 1 [compost metagenome]
MKDPHVVRIVALSGGYSQTEANEKLARNHGLIASFSRALSEGLNAGQSNDEFDGILSKSIQDIYEASIK